MFTLASSRALVRAGPLAEVSPTLLIALIGIAFLLLVGSALLDALAALAEIAWTAIAGIFIGIRALLVVAVGIVVLVLIVLGSGDQPSESVLAPGAPPTSTAAPTNPPPEAMPPAEPGPDGN